MATNGSTTKVRPSQDMPGNGRADRKRLSQDERSAQILECARRLFSEQHPGAVSIEDVARAADITPGLVHHYFGTKRDLYLAVVREMLRGGAPPVPEYVRGVGPEQRLAEAVDRWLDRVERNRETWLAAVGAQGIGSDPEVEEMLDRVSESAVDNLIEVLGAGPADEAAPELRALIRGYGGLAEAISRQWLVHGRLSREQTHTVLTRSLLKLIEDVLPLVLAGTAKQEEMA